jgi:ribosomal-protein-alanine N-acetyltransferase
MNSREVIETARLWLRRPVQADAETIFTRYAGDPLVTRFLSWPTHRNLADTLAFLSWSDREWERAPAGPYLVLARKDDRLLGSTGLMFESPERATTGYVFARNEWGHGYATESLHAMVDLARDLGVGRLEGICHVDHRPSAHVMEKCGFTFEGIHRNHTEFPNLARGVKSDVRSYARAF